MRQGKVWVFGAAKHGRALSSPESDPPPVGPRKEKIVCQLGPGSENEPEALDGFWYSLSFAWFYGFGRQRSEAAEFFSRWMRLSRRVVYDDEDD